MTRRRIGAVCAGVAVACRLGSDPGTPSSPTGPSGSGSPTAVTGHTGTSECDETPGGLVPFAPCPADNGEYSIDAASVNGDLLTADLDYGGGCCYHEFALCWDDQAFQPGDLARLSIAFLDQNDPCDLGYLDSRVFSLEPLKQAWLDQGGDPSATLQIELDGIALTYAL